MILNKWTLALASAGVISSGLALKAEEQHQVLTALSQTTLSGYVDTSAIWSVGNDFGAGIPGRTFDGTPDKLDGFNLHAVKLVLEKPLDEGQWSAGYKADLVFGPDANYYSTRSNGGSSMYTAQADSEDFNVKQAYVALRAPVGNGLDIKIGVWDTLIGYEVFESANNPNFSRSYGYAIEPTHHTGVLMSYHVADWLSVSGGIANGWTGGINDRIAGPYRSPEDGEARKAFLGSLTITLPESTGSFKGSSIYAGIVYGNATGGATSFNDVNENGNVQDGVDITSTYVGATLNTPIEALSIGAAFDYRDGAPAPVFGNNAYAWTAALYASFAATEKLKLNARAEYAQGSNGSWYTYYGFNEGASTNDKNALGAITLTVDYALWANVVTRGEIRYDRNMAGDHVYHGKDTDIDALTIAANIVYKF